MHGPELLISQTNNLASGGRPPLLIFVRSQSRTVSFQFAQRGRCCATPSTCTLWQTLRDTKFRIFVLLPGNESDTSLDLRLIPPGWETLQYDDCEFVARMLHVSRGAFQRFCTTRNAHCYSLMRAVELCNQLINQWATFRSGLSNKRLVQGLMLTTER